MGRKGDLLELIDDAPRGVTSLSGSVWRWTNRRRTREAYDRLSAMSNVLVTSGREWDTATTDEHLRFVCALPIRWRIENGHRVEIRDGDTHWSGTRSRMHEHVRDRAHLADADIGLLVRPGPFLFGLFDLGDITDDEVLGRPSVMVEAVTRTTRETMRATRIVLRLGGTAHKMWFDAETGVLLRHVGLVDGEPCTITEFTAIAFDPPEAALDSTFRPADSAEITRHVDALIGMAESQGVDLTGIDRDDPSAVREAIFERRRHLRNTPTRAVVDRRRDMHVPMGPPPADEAAARDSIVYAYSHHDEKGDSDLDLVNVQGGAGLAGPLHEAQKRVPGTTDAEVRIVVDDIRFLREDEAVVWFTLEIGEERSFVLRGHEGRAVKVDDRWMIERATLGGLLALAGVEVPPANR